MRSQDISFLEEATRQVYNNRNMLKNSYVYAYNMTKKNILPAEKNLFEYLQNDLERQTDILNEHIEMPIEHAVYEDFIDWKEKVTNYTRISEKVFE